MKRRQQPDAFEAYANHHGLDVPADDLYDYISPEEVAESVAEEYQELARRYGKAQAEIDRLRQLMAEAVRDFHGKSVLFSSEFLEAAEREAKYDR